MPFIRAKQLKDSTKTTKTDTCNSSFNLLLQTCRASSNYNARIPYLLLSLGSDALVKALLLNMFLSDSERLNLISTTKSKDLDELTEKEKNTFKSLFDNLKFNSGENTEQTIPWDYAYSVLRNSLLLEPDSEFSSLIVEPKPLLLHNELPGNRL